MFGAVKVLEHYVFAEDCEQQTDLLQPAATLCSMSDHAVSTSLAEPTQTALISNKRKLSTDQEDEKQYRRLHIPSYLPDFPTTDKMQLKKDFILRMYDEYLKRRFTMSQSPRNKNLRPIQTIEDFELCNFPLISQMPMKVKRCLSYKSSETNNNLPYTLDVSGLNGMTFLREKALTLSDLNIKLRDSPVTPLRNRYNVTPRYCPLPTFKTPFCPAKNTSSASLALPYFIKPPNMPKKQ